MKSRLGELGLHKHKRKNKREKMEKVPFLMLMLMFMLLTVEVIWCDLLAIKSETEKYFSLSIDQNPK